MQRRFSPAALLAASSLLAAASLPVPALATPAEGSGVAWEIVEGLTTEIGARLAGSPEEGQARLWAEAKLNALGFQNVKIEPFKTLVWTRGEERAKLTAPYAHALAITALGLSAPTPAKGLQAELVYFPTLDALRAAPDGSLKGKIAFVDHAMRAAQDGSGYGPYGDVRAGGRRSLPRRGLRPLSSARPVPTAIAIRTPALPYLPRTWPPFRPARSPTPMPT